MRENDREQEDMTEILSKREDFFKMFFSKGAEFASELLEELESLRMNTKKLTEENINLRHQLASDDAIRDLLKKIESLEEEKNKLHGHVQHAAAETEDYAGRYAEVEKELDTMANLYVALYQLHSTISPQEVLGVIEQLLAQFVGAGSFVIYLKYENGGEKVIRPVHAYHCENASGTQINWNEGPIGEAAATQINYITDPKTRKAGSPIACIPMVLGEETIGVIAIFSFFEQKEEFVAIDFEFFKLLAIHSASAIVGCGLMVDQGSIRTSIGSYQHL